MSNFIGLLPSLLLMSNEEGMAWAREHILEIIAVAAALKYWQRKLLWRRFKEHDYEGRVLHENQASEQRGKKQTEKSRRRWI